MKRLPTRLTGLVLALLFILCPVGFSQSEPDRHAAPQLNELLTRGTKYETQRQWQQAADLYERALRLYPEDTSLRERWQKAERLFSLSRRYHDASFTSELLSLPESKALALYREILRKVDTHYVKSISLDHLVDIGYRNLELALGEEVFIRTNFLVPSQAGINTLREQLAELPKRKVLTIGQALDEVEHAGVLCRKAGMRHATPVILEFVTAACEGLDPYSTHLSPNRLRDLYSMIDGNFVGLGIEVRGNVKGLEIVSVLPGSPAEEANLKPGDLLVSVDGQDLAGIGAEEAANRLQGVAGSRVLLGIEHIDGSKVITSVTRREVVVHSVTRYKLLDEETGVGYLRLGSFQKLTVRELEEAVDRLLRSGMTSLIIDLRGNPGGLLDVALQVANHFIDDGILVSTRGRAWGQSFEHTARPSAAIWRFPLAVLVDGDSASASEIFAGAVKDHGRGTVVGTTTYGKGSVQSIFPLRAANTGLRLTTAYFYSPTGKVYQNAGVEPDVYVSRELDPLGVEVPVPTVPTLDNDPQLRAAYHILSQSARIEQQAAR